MRRHVQDPGDVLNAHGLRLHQLSRHRIDRKLLVLDTILEEWSLEVRCRLEVLQELTVCLVSEITVSLQHRLDVTTLAIELAGKLLLCERLAQSHGVIDDSIHADYTIQRHLHEVEHVLVRVCALKELEVRISDGHLVPLVTIGHCDLYVGRMHLIQRDRHTSIVSLDDCICIAPSLEPAHDSHPECDGVGVLVRMMQDLVSSMSLVRCRGSIRVHLLDRLRQRCDVLSDETDAGEECRQLQRRAIGDRHAEVNVIHVRRQRRTVSADANAAQPCTPLLERS